MKSKINELADYREAPFQKEVTITCPDEHINVQMKHLTRKFKKTEAISEVAKGDVVVLSLVSELTKFNRPMVPITVGSHLFDEELEAQLIIIHVVKALRLPFKTNRLTLRSNKPVVHCFLSQPMKWPLRMPQNMRNLRGLQR